MPGSLIKSLIIDDDPFSINLLKVKLDQFFHNIDVVGSAGNGNEGLQKIDQLLPDLVFLDVEMPDMTGMEMLGKLDKIDFQVIFTTAFRHYAIPALRLDALDYLVKPVDLGDLRNAIKRYKQKIKTEWKNPHYNVVYSPLFIEILLIPTIFAL